MANHHGPTVAESDEEIIVFLVGMTFNRPWRVRSWWPIFTAMPKMLRALEADPDSGLLATSTNFGRRGPIIVQYWKSLEHLDRFARGRDTEHSRAWAAFMRSDRMASGDVGLWHETYVTRPGMRENLYLSADRVGMGAAVPTHPRRTGEETAAKRMQAGARATDAAGAVNEGAPAS